MLVQEYLKKIKNIQEVYNNDTIPGRIYVPLGLSYLMTK